MTNSQTKTKQNDEIGNNDSTITRQPQDNHMAWHGNDETIIIHDHSRQDKIRHYHQTKEITRQFNHEKRARQGKVRHDKTT
jgi:hypothetical protein